MQSSGVGNCINMLSLPIAHRTPLPMIVTMRGDYGEFNPFQVPMGNATQTVLEAMGTLVKRADTPGGRGAHRGCHAAPRLQHLPPDRDPDRPARHRRQDLREGLTAHDRRAESRQAGPPRRRPRAARRIAATCWSIAGLGAPAWDITAAGDCPQNLPLWGGMGGAAMMGLGLALAQPDAARCWSSPAMARC